MTTHSSQVRSIDPLDPVQRYERARRKRRWVIVLAAIFLLGVWIYWGIFAEVPRDHADIHEHFKYGSIGSEEGEGVPYWIWQVLPELFPDYLPDPQRFSALPPERRKGLTGYEQFGFIVEPGNDVPVGFSKRRLIVERVGLNCGVCHTGTVKVTSDMVREACGPHSATIHIGSSDRLLILGMPAHGLDLTAYIQFLINCGKDPRFDVTYVLDGIKRRTQLGPIDSLLYRQAVPRVRRELERLAVDLAFLNSSPPAGPGRVDTFNPYKSQVFGFPFDGSVGSADFPSIWNQRAREGMQLHWDGNNKSVFERNISASLGAGATPVSLDLPRMLRVADWLGAPDPHRDLTTEEIVEARAQPWPREGELPVPKFPFAIDASLARHGESIYHRYCASCHDWQGAEIGQVVPIAQIGTDPNRLNSFTRELAANQNTLGAGQWWRFRHFRKTNGYVNMPLDGVWARAPYLHNGSVPNLRLLLEPTGGRPMKFYRGDDEYEPQNLGFRFNRATNGDGRRLHDFDTALPGNGRQGHEGEKYGTNLIEKDKQALIEYLKTL